ncbi:unnamed protein product [Mucor hiemalis]
MLHFIPFIPQNTPGVSNEIWKKALYAWNVNFIELLDLPTKVFLQEVESNETLFTFIDQVLDEQLNTTSDSVDSSLLKHVFLFYTKLASSPSLNSNYLTMDRLCSFVIVYGETNSLQVRDIMTKLITNSSVLEQNLFSTMGMLLDAIQSMPDPLSKSCNTEILNRAYVLVRVLDALMSATIHLDSIKNSFDTLDIVLIDCYSNLIPHLEKAVDDDYNNAAYAYLIKQSLVSIFNSFADGHFFLPLGYISSVEDHHHLDSISTAVVEETVLDYMSEKILGYIEGSGLESSKTAFVNGPLVMDWEVEYHITEKLDEINNKTFGGSEDRIEFLKLSMEQVRDANEGTGPWGDTLQKRTKSKKPDTPVFEDMERISMISQVHGLFPDLGDGFIEACLEANDDNVEMVIMQLLEDNLPPSLAQLDRNMMRKPLMSAHATVEELKHLEADAAARDSLIEQEFEEGEPQEESILNSRKNVYDNDEFDIFARRTVDASKVYVGKKDKGNADSLLDDKTFIQTEKQNVLQRVVDMYDDDYDDTYDDINDAGVPSTVDNDDFDVVYDYVKKKQEVVDPSVQNESLLVHTFAENPEIFTRNGTTRKSAKRDALKKRTGMSDEQLKGWAIMFNRNPRKNRILDKYMLFDGNQKQVTQDESQAQKDSLKKENKRPPISETKDRAYKDKNKARFGNHNRKANRDKKIAKTAPPPS